ncbi:MAG: sulfotransferase domain-containing protein [Dermatophilaceae bacterium]
MDIRRTGADLVAPLRPLLSGRSSMEPSFLVVGTKRGGTTSAYHWIAQHPQVAPCRTRKGTHYFDVNFERGERWFRSGFEGPRAPWKITGEASPYYMFHPLAPRRIAETLPAVHLIVVLREPVARAWSHHQYEVARGSEDLAFETALDLESKRLEGEEERLTEDPSYESFEHRHHSYLARGLYAEQLGRLLDLFPRDQLLVLQSEELFADPRGQLDRVWDFLGLERVRLDGLQALKPGTYGAMPPKVRTRLQSYYAEHNQELYSLPGIDFRWPYERETAS